MRRKRKGRTGRGGEGEGGGEGEKVGGGGRGSGRGGGGGNKLNHLKKEEEMEAKNLLVQMKKIGLAIKIYLESFPVPRVLIRI